MKRLIAVSLILALCLSFAAAASADTNINVDVSSGGDAFVDINVGSGGDATNVVVNGTPIDPPDPEEDPGKAARVARNREVKEEARAVFEYLESELERIGWAHENYKIIRSFEVRVIYGSKGSNNSRDRAPITFYYEDDPSIKVKCYMITLYGKKYFPVLFATSFRTGKHADEYDDGWLINSRHQNGTEAVDAFIEYLESITPGS